VRRIARRWAFGAAETGASTAFWERDSDDIEPGSIVSGYDSNVTAGARLQYR
jgi:hypothetical protein